MSALEVNVEKEHVHKVYSQIASHFSDTRFKPWPKIAEFLRNQPLGSIIADVGCGNGKYLGVNPGVSMLGSDICPELVSIGRRRGHEVIISDCLNLPYKTSLFDGLICIAVIHHLSTDCRRLAAIREMVRILRPGGTMLLYVWAMEQERKKFECQDVMVPWHLQPKYTPKGVPLLSSKRSRKKKTRSKREKIIIDGRRPVDETKLVEDAAESLLGALDFDEHLHPSGDVVTMELESCSVHQNEGTQSNKTLNTDGANVQENSELGQGSVLEHEQKLELEVGLLGKSGQGQGSVLEHEQKLELEGLLGKSGREQALEGLGYSIYQRYYHVFRQGELAGLVQKVPGVVVKQEYYDHENWCVLAMKTNNE